MRTTSLAWIFACTSTAWACSSGPNTVSNPTPAQAGGVSNPGINTELNVFVIDSKTSTAIGGAQVRVGLTSDASALTGATASNGLITFTDADKLQGPQTVTVTAQGYTTATWIGVNGAVVTIPMDSLTNATAPYASVQGTIAGWSTFPNPVAGHALIGAVTYSKIDPLNAADNSITQMLNGNIPANWCIRTALAATDNCGAGGEGYHLRARTGKQALYATIFDITVAGLKDPVVQGYAILQNQTFAANDNLTGVNLDLVASTDMADVTVDFENVPVGFLQTTAEPIVALGDQGRMNLEYSLFSQQNPVLTSVLLPKLTGPFASATYEFIGASENAKDMPIPGSEIFQFGTDVTQTVQLSQWLPSATNIAVTGGVYSFTQVPGAQVHTAKLVTMSTAATVEWSITILDGTTSFTLPTLSPDPLSMGAHQFQVQAYQVPGFDPGNWSVAQVLENPFSTSTNQQMFTH